jgi:NhaA family Na+:H+ antiporter
MSDAAAQNRLDRPVLRGRDHVLGPDDAPFTLVEYGSYGCPYCRAANEEVVHLRERYGDRLRYVFRQRPITGSDLARRAAEIAETAPGEDAFWRAHVALMSRSRDLTEEDLAAVVADVALPQDAKARRARRRASTRTSRAHGKAACG